MRRYIYLHGAPESAELGRPGSIGCIRMRGPDIIELFDRVPPYTGVEILG
jgi:lipoprotein-anchoring transpeptidase ErfK/SrfK